MLNSKQRAELRAQSNNLDTTLMVGKGGVTEAVIAEAESQLTARELVKGKVLEGDPCQQVRPCPQGHPCPPPRGQARAGAAQRLL